MLLKEVYENARVVRSGPHLTTVNEFSDQLPALRPDVLREAAVAALKVMESDIDKIVTEEDKGAPLATAVALMANKSLALARWYPYSLGSNNEIEVDIQSEYFQGRLYLNGIQKGDRVAIIDDTISTGGALISLIESVRAAGGVVVDAICVIEKNGKGGRTRVLERTGLEVKTILTIDVSEHGVSVLG